MKNIKLLACAFLSLLVISSCNNQKSNENTVVKMSTVAEQDPVKFTPAMVDNKRDPSCGMPVAAGIEDTIHYKNKVLGFCSKECKDEFLKDPEKNIAAADLKK